jgi:hypothetical protein
MDFGEREVGAIIRLTRPFCSIWPFDGDFTELIARGGIVIAETPNGRSLRGNEALSLSYGDRCVLAKQHVDRARRPHLARPAPSRY